MTGAVRARLADGRLHLHHGPIDLLISIAAGAAETVRAEEQAWTRFQPLLDELVSELPLLRTPLSNRLPVARGAVARRMCDAAWPYHDGFITPMAAVAGAVADEVLTALRAGRTLRKAIVNNGGDIAFHLAEGESLASGVVGNTESPAVDAFARVDWNSVSRGLATSGWRGRSHSLGIADAVTVFARTAADADAAATLIANAVNAEHAAVQRRPARALKEDSDLGNRLVTVAVGDLPIGVRDAALERGVTCAQRLRTEARIESALILLQGAARAVVEPRTPARRREIAIA